MTKVAIQISDIKIATGSRQKFLNIINCNGHNYLVWDWVQSTAVPSYELCSFIFFLIPAPLISLFNFSTTALGHWSLFLPFSSSLYLWVCVPIPHQCTLAMGTLRCVSSLLTLPLNFTFPITCNFPFHLPQILLFCTEQFPFFTAMCSAELSLPLLPSHLLTQLFFLGHIDLTFSSVSPMEFITS